MTVALAKLFILRDPAENHDQLFLINDLQTDPTSGICLIEVTTYSRKNPDMTSVLVFDRDGMNALIEEDLLVSVAQFDDVAIAAGVCESWQSGRDTVAVSAMISPAEPLT